MVYLLLLKLSIYKKSILNSKIGLPKNIWTPSGGNIFVNIFRQVCKSNGSKVVTHEHGSGSGFFLDYGRTLATLEYQSCTDFFAYTKKNKDEYNKYLRKDLIIDEELPNIISLKESFSWPYDRLNFLEKFFNKKKKYILYIPSIFIHDNYFDGKLVDAHNTYNWLIKLSNFFKKNNFNFRVKPHPSTIIPREYMRYYKKNVIKDNLAKSIENSNLIITDQPSSSSFAASVVSNKPMIFIDLKVQDFTEHAKIHLKERCIIINAKFTQEGIDLNWEILKKSILNPKKNFSHNFKNTYFENTME